jgi:hypothetical protein
MEMILSNGYMSFIAVRSSSEFRIEIENGMEDQSIHQDRIRQRILDMFAHQLGISSSSQRINYENQKSRLRLKLMIFSGKQ